MQRLKLIGIRALTVAALAVVVVIGLATFSGPRDASANVPDPSGVYCAFIDTVLSQDQGIVLVRIDLDFALGGNPNDVAFTSVQYFPRGSADCQSPGASPPDPIPQTGGRPQIDDAKYDPSTNHLAGTVCQENAEFIGITFDGFSKFDIDFDFLDPPAKTDDSNAFGFTPNAGPGCTLGSPISVEITGGKWLDGPGGVKSDYDSDWDGDGCLDWDELAQFGASDPFNPDDCSPAGAVGGVAEIVDTDSAPLDATSSSGTSAWLIAAIAAAVAGTIALGGTAVFARRRAGR